MSSVVPAAPAQEHTLESYQDWADRLYDSLESVTPRVAAASKYAKQSPNPMIQIGDDAGTVVNLSLPLEPSQLGVLRQIGGLLPAADMGMEYIPSQFLKFRNPDWSQYVTDMARKLVLKQFMVDKTEFQFEFAFVASSERPACGFGQVVKEAQANDKRFATLLVTLPTFDEFDVTVTRPDAVDPIAKYKQTAATIGYLSFTLWYHGAVPTVSSRGTTLCLLYTIYLPQEHARSYQPWQLSLPDDASVMGKLRGCLQDFAAGIRGDIINKIAYWIFDRDHGSYDRISGNDFARCEKLVKAALDAGVYVYYARLKRVEEGTPEGWVAPEDRDYDYYGYRSRYSYWDEEPEPELETDSHGKYILDTELDIETSISLGDFYNIQLSKAENKNLVLYNADEEQFIPYEPEFSTTSHNFEQDYDGEGSLANIWTRSVLVMWPRELHAEIVNELFGWRCAYFLDQTAPVEGDDGNIKKESIDIAEKFLLSPGTCSKPGRYEELCNNVFGECRRLFLNFSRLSRRLDLFASTLRKFGLPERDEDFALLREAVDTFSSTGNEDSRIQLINMCLASEPDAKKQLELAIKIFGQQVVGGFIGKHFTGKELGNVFTTKELLKADKETLRNVIIPRVGCLDKSSYWLTLLEHFKDDPEIITQYLPLVAEQLKASFKPPSPAPPPPRAPGSYYYPPPPHTIPEPPETAWVRNTTFRLLSLALSTKNLKSAALILRSIVKNANAPKECKDKRAFYFHVLSDIQELLRSTNTPVSAHPAIPHFFQCMIMKHIMHRLGTAPLLPAAYDLKLPQLSCSTRNCRQCGAISIFLIAPHEETRTWTLSKANRAHVVAAIESQSAIRRHIRMSETQPKGCVGTLTLKKVGMSYADRASAYERTRATIEQEVKALSPCLGQGPWPRIIFGALVKGGAGYTDTLKAQKEHLLDAEFPINTTAPSTAGQKRPLEEEAEKENSQVVQQQQEPPKKKYTIIDLVSSDEED